ncbi:GIY-YIG nuclease family protein [Stutzerimonas kunmingensis]|uniref:GIY-YIG nuclease family protein n=1 Tax=Stutzerimonas kunmingensis TaxID=1211807 RepID=UPI00241D73B2|nr:GIY-YIG nuclease family protein [Stutzerimonas kunmingensis]
MTRKPHSIRIFLLDGIPDGVRTAEIIMSTIEAIAFPRSLLGRVRSELNLSRPGVYLLAGEDIDHPGRMIGYIGESEDLARRLVRHEGDAARDFWTDTVVFTSKDENLTKAHVRYIEAELIKIARKNPAWQQPNVQAPPSAGKLPIADQVAMDEFVRQARTIAGTLGFQIFKVIEDEEAVQERAPVVPARASPAFELRGEGYRASGVHSAQSGDFIVKAGSVARKEVNSSLQVGSKRLREELLANGVLTEAEGGLTFTRDHAFSSPSAAAGLICGSSTNGRTNWKTATGITYGDYLGALVVSDSLETTLEAVSTQGQLVLEQAALNTRAGLLSGLAMT